MLKPEHIQSLCADFEKSAKGFIDFLLLGNDGKPLIVLEAKSEDNDPRVGKEEARKYARSQNARFVILSNRNIHCRWDLEYCSADPTPSFEAWRALFLELGTPTYLRLLLARSGRPQSAQTGRWPSQKSAAKLQLLRLSFAARFLESFQERPECCKSQDFRDSASALRQ